MSWKLYTRDANLQRQGEIDDFTECQLKPVFNDVGTWSLTIDRRSSQAVGLTTPGWGIVAVRGGTTILSGPGRTRRHMVDGDKNQVTISGFTDDVWLHRRRVSPSPTESSPPYTTSAYDVRTGQASTVLRQYADVNAGPGAVSTRRVTNLVIGSDPLVGSTVTGNGRWDNLLTLLQGLAVNGAVGFRVIHVGDTIEFQVYQPTDRTTTVKFSLGLANLEGFEYESEAPEANYIYVGGQGEGTARAILERPDSSSIATWGRIEGDFVDRRDTTDTKVLAQAGDEALAEGQEKATLSVTPIETPTSRYGEHYSLGDKVTVQLEGPARTPYAESGQIQDVLRSVEINLTPDGQVVKPAIGTPPRTDVFRLFRAFRQLKADVSLLKRR